jgi:ATP-binding cassette subfamily B protein
MAGPMGRMMAGTGPEHRSLDFKVSGRRLVAQFKPERLTIWVLLLCVVVSVGLTVVGPKILGQATDLVFAGIVGREMPPGATKEQVLQDMRDRGDGDVADMLRSTDFTPGEGIDFTAVGNVLLVALVVFSVAGLLMAVATRLVNRAVNRTMFRLREDVQVKLGRLPLSYFDKRQRGEVLSRATNDIDNIGQTLQQSMGQLINSVLTIIGVLAMMFWVSWILALVALVTVPLSFYIATRVGKRSQPHFVQQWRSTGKLNAHVEEMYTGHTLVKVFGRQDESAQQFAEQNEALYEAGFKAQFNSGVMQPLMMFVSNLNYVLVAVVGGLRVASGAWSAG